MKHTSIKVNLLQTNKRKLRNWKKVFARIFTVVIAITIVAAVVRFIDRDLFIFAGIRRSIFIFVPFALLIFRNTVLVSSQLSRKWVFVGILGLAYLLGWSVAIHEFPEVEIGHPPLLSYFIILLVVLLVSAIVRFRQKRTLWKIVKNTQKKVSSISKIEQAEKRREEQFEMGRYAQTRKAHPIINKIPIANKLYRFISAQGTFYAWGLLLSVVMLVVLSVPLMGRFIGGDEFHIYNTGKGLIETSRCVAWNFLYDAPGYVYEGECFVSAIVSVFYRIFGVSLFSAKLPFLLFSILNVFLLYSLVKKLINKKLALLIVFFYITNPFFVWHTNYIRVYVILVTLSLVIFLSILSLIRTKNLRAIIGYVLLISLSFYFGLVGRISFISLLPGVLTIIIIKTVSLIESKNVRRLFYTLIFVSATTLALFYSQILQIFSGFYVLDWKYKWHAFNLSLLTFSPFIAKLLFGALIVSGIVFLIAHRKRLNVLRRNAYSKVFALFSIFIFAHIIYGLFVKQNAIIPRYTIQLILPNFIFLSISLIYIIRLAIRNAKASYALVGVILLITNIVFWTRYSINGKYSSEYNYIDMYVMNDATSEGRRKERYDQMYKTINEHINPQDTKIGLITAFFNDPQVAALQDFQERIDMIGIGDYSSGLQFSGIPYKTKYREIILGHENYESIGHRYPMKKEVLKKYSRQYDKLFVTWETRKSYKHTIILSYLEELGFAKISGEGVDDSNIEIYFITKDRATASEN